MGKRRRIRNDIKYFVAKFSFSIKMHVLGLCALFTFSETTQFILLFYIKMHSSKSGRENYKGEGKAHPKIIIIKLNFITKLLLCLYFDNLLVQS